MRPTLSTPLCLALLLAIGGGCIIVDKSDDSAASNDSTPGETEEETDFHWPSKDGYEDPGKPGWQGRTRISTTEGCWKDTDGVEPDIAGCHTLQAGDDACSACEDEVTERIGEACYTFSRTTESGETETATWLIETNPDAGVCHPHAGGVGHPDVFDCEAFCVGTTNPETGEPYATGDCVEVVDESCPGAAQDSAWCACSG